MPLQTMLSKHNKPLTTLRFFVAFITMKYKIITLLDVFSACVDERHGSHKGDEEKGPK